MFWKGKFRKAALDNFIIFAVAESVASICLAAWLVIYGWNVWVYATFSLLYVSVVSMTINKAKGLSILLNKIGLKREELMAFGDGYNDIPMLQFAGMGVAMDNAADEIKKAADKVAPNNDDDGIAVFLEKEMRLPCV